MLSVGRSYTLSMSCSESCLPFASVSVIVTSVFAAAAVFTFLQTPVYTAEATLLIEPTDPQVIDIKHVFGESFGYESSYYVTQTEMLRSRSLAAQVI